MDNLFRNGRPYLQSPLVKVVCCTVLCIFATVVLAESTIRDGTIPIDQLRASQQKQLDALREQYRTLANQPGADQADLLQRYNAEQQRITGKHDALDTRNTRVKAMIKNTGAAQTGSDTRDVRADVDTAGNTTEIDDKMIEELKSRGHDIDTSDPSKVVDRTDDHVYWRSETEAGNRAKQTDYDAYKTTGGREATGSPGEVRDARGEAIDLSSKYHHGRADGDLKTMGKAVSKIDKASDRVTFDADQNQFAKDKGEFRRSLAEHPDRGVRELAEIDPRTGKSQADTIVRQAEAFQKYGDPVTAGIADLADSPEVQQRKVSEWQNKANKLMKAAEQRAASRGDVRDAVREQFGQSYRDANPADPVEGDLNRQAADEIDAARQRVRETNEVGEAFLSGEKRKKTAQDTYSGGWKDRGQPIEGAIPDEELKARLGEADARLNRTGADAGGGTRAPSSIETPDASTSLVPRKSAGALGVDDLPVAPKSTAWTEGAGDVARIGSEARVTPLSDAKINKGSTDIGLDAMSVIEAGLQASEATAKQLGKVLDREDKSVTGGDLAEVVGEASGYTPMKKAITDTRLQQQIKKIELGNRIKELQERKEPLSAEEKQTLDALTKQWESADSTTSNLAELGQKMIADPQKEIIGRRMGEMEAQAKAEGRKPEFIRDGIPAMAKIGAEAVGSATGIGSAANTAAEISTFDERADWSAQKKYMTEHLNSKANRTHWETRKMSRELDHILYKGDLNDPATRQRVDQLLAGIAANQAEMQRIVAIADGNLSEVDPEKLTLIRGLAKSHPDANAMRDYANQMINETKRRKAEEEKAKLAKAKSTKDKEQKASSTGAARATQAQSEDALNEAITEIMLTEPDPEKRKAMIAEAIRKHTGSKSKASQADGGWGDSGAGGWGEGGFEKTSPAERYIGEIQNAYASCEFDHALNVADKAIRLDPDHVWLRQNHSTIRVMAERSAKYQRAIRSAISSLQQGRTTESVSSLKVAMANASTQCGQDEEVRSVLADAQRIEQMEREAVIDKARWEAERAASKRRAERELYERKQAERAEAAQALHGALMGIAGIANRAANRSGGSVNTGASPRGSSDEDEDFVRRMARENERKYGDMIRKSQQGNSFRAPPSAPPKVRASTSTPTTPSASSWSSSSSTGGFEEADQVDWSTDCKKYECFEDARF